MVSTSLFVEMGASRVEKTRVGSSGLIAYGGIMLERAKIRCPVCRSNVPAVVVWAAGDVCPRCDTALKVERARTSDTSALDGARPARGATAGSEPGSGRRLAAGSTPASRPGY